MRADYSHFCKEYSISIVCKHTVHRWDAWFVQINDLLSHKESYQMYRAFLIWYLIFFPLFFVSFLSFILSMFDDCLFFFLLIFCLVRDLCVYSWCVIRFSLLKPKDFIHPSIHYLFGMACGLIWLIDWSENCA